MKRSDEVEVVEKAHQQALLHLEDCVRKIFAGVVGLFDELDDAASCWPVRKT